MSASFARSSSISPLVLEHRREGQNTVNYLEVLGLVKRLLVITDRGQSSLPAYYLVHGDLPRQHSFGTTLRFTGPVPADSRQ